MKKIIIYILLISWMGLIFFFSNQSSVDSDKSSGFIIEKLIDFKEIIIGRKLTYTEIETLYDYMVVPIRKFAHFTLYFVLGVLFYILIKEYNIKNNLILSILFCIVYACSDEIHQLFIDGRSGMITDVIIDTIGSIIGILITKKIVEKIRIQN